MPAAERFEAAIGRDENQRRRSKNVANKDPAASQDEERDTLVPSQLQ
jgi:hypothetical protein